MKKLATLGMAGLLAVGILGACGKTDDGNKGEATTAKDALTFGFVPSGQSLQELEDQTKPFVTYLSEELGRDVDVVIEPTFDDMAKKMGEGDVDASFMGSFAFVNFEEASGLEPLVKGSRFGSGSYKAQYNVAADSKFETIEDLLKADGLVWSVPDKGSTSGYLFPASQMMDMGLASIDALKVIESGGHDGAIRPLLVGDADFATTFVDARENLKEEYPDIEKTIRVIGFTEDIPNDNISAVKSLDAATKEALKKALMDLPNHEEALEALRSVYQWDGVTDVTSKEYDVVRSVVEKFNK